MALKWRRRINFESSYILKIIRRNTNIVIFFPRKFVSILVVKNIRKINSRIMFNHFKIQRMKNS